MPAQGKYPVKIGSSLNRALKARKQGGTPPATNPRRNLPDRDFYSFRYNFKPPAIDSTKTGTIEVKRGKEKTQVAVEHSSSQAGEAYVFAGTETQAKEWDVVLIYDDESGEYTLEKLDSFVNLTWERKRTSAAPAPSPVAPSPSDMDAEGDNDEELEKELLGLAEDIPLAKTIKQRPSQPPPRAPPPRKEEEEEEEIFIPPVQEPAPQPPPKQQQSSKKSTSRATKPIPKARPSAAAATEPTASPMANAPQPAAAPTQKAAQKAKKRKEQEPSGRQSDPEVEDLTFGKPAKRAKVPAATAAAIPPQPTPAPSAGFALPGSSSSGFFQPPPPPVPVSKPQKGGQHSAMPEVADEDSEEDWEEIANVDPPPRALSYHSDEGEEVGDGLFGDEDGEADLEDELANQLDAELGGDFLEEALSEPQAPSAKVPLSWGQLAAATGGPDGVMEDDSDEDFSSSDDSDDY